MLTFPPGARLGEAHRGGLKRKQTRGFGHGVWLPEDLARDARALGCSARRGEEGGVVPRRRDGTQRSAQGAASLRVAP